MSRPRLEDVTAELGGAERQEIGLVRMDTVERRKPQWWWRGLLLVGKLHLLEGDPDVGKSLVMIDIAARISCGDAMPDGSGGKSPRNVLFMICEDGIADTLGPRLDAAGADSSRIFVLRNVADGKGRTRLPSLAADLGVLRSIIVEHAIALVIVEPVKVFMGRGTDDNSEAEVSDVLGPLIDLAEETGATFLLLRHWTKSEGRKAIHRGGGSIAWTSRVRGELAVARDPDDEAVRVIAPAKCNLVRDEDKVAWRFRLVSWGVDPDVPRVQWEGPCNVTADELSAPEHGEGRSKLEDAMAILRELLADADEVDAEQARVEVKRIACCKDSTVDRARKLLGVTSRRVGGVGSKGRWLWRLPRSGGGDDLEEVPKTDTHGGVEALQAKASSADAWCLSPKAPSGRMDAETVDSAKSPPPHVRAGKGDEGDNPGRRLIRECTARMMARAAEDR